MECRSGSIVAYRGRQLSKFPGGGRGRSDSRDKFRETAVRSFSKTRILAISRAESQPRRRNIAVRRVAGVSPNIGQALEIAVPIHEDDDRRQKGGDDQLGGVVVSKVQSGAVRHLLSGAMPNLDADLEAKERHGLGLLLCGLRKPENREK